MDAGRAAWELEGHGAIVTGAAQGIGEASAVAVFLASDHASFVTGATMNVGGGAWMG